LLLIHFQDAKFDKEKQLNTTCGKIERTADSSEENSFIKKFSNANLDSHTNGLKLRGVLEDQHQRKEDSNTILEVQFHPSSVTIK